MVSLMDPKSSGIIDDLRMDVLYTHVPPEAPAVLEEL